MGFKYKISYRVGGTGAWGFRNVYAGSRESAKRMVVRKISQEKEVGEEFVEVTDSEVLPEEVRIEAGDVW